jgi:hypothetical protein
VEQVIVERRLGSDVTGERHDAPAPGERDGGRALGGRDEVERALLVVCAPAAQLLRRRK